MMLHGLFELLITLGDSDTHNANDLCLYISDFRGGDDDGAGDDEDDDEKKEEEDDVMEEPKLTETVLGKLVVKIKNKIGLATKNCAGIETDGCNVMASKVCGAVATIQEAAPHAVRCPCNNHSLNLSLASLARTSTAQSIRNAVAWNCKIHDIVFQCFCKTQLRHEAIRRQAVAGPL